MLKVKLTASDLQQNEALIGEVLKKRQLQQITGGLYTQVPPSYCDTCYVNSGPIYEPIPYTQDTQGLTHNGGNGIWKGIGNPDNTTPAQSV